MKRITLLLTAIFIASVSFAQVSKKEALERNIKSVAEWETKLKTRKARPIQESYTKYDQNGNIIESMERDNSGKVTLHEKYTYDDAGNKTIEIQMYADGSVKKKHVYTYDSKNLRISRTSYNSDGKIIAEKKYIYEYYKN